MDEKEWLACDDPQVMLEFLKGPVSGRKLRLFGAACCRRIPYPADDDAQRGAVEAAERFADGEGAEGELTAAFGKAMQARTEPPRSYSAVLDLTYGGDLAAAMKASQ